MTLSPSTRILLFWALLAAPILPYLGYLATAETVNWHRMTNEMGDWCAYFLILSLCATPLSMIFRGRYGTRRLVKNRRYIGVASFGYGVLHAVTYFPYAATLERVIADLSWFYILSGWFAFLLMIPPAITSTDAMMRRLRANWKQVQRLAYAVALFGILHWASLYEWRQIGKSLYHFSPFLILTLVRIGINLHVRSRRRLARAG